MGHDMIAKMVARCFEYLHPLACLLAKVLHTSAFMNRYSLLEHMLKVFAACIVFVVFISKWSVISSCHSDLMLNCYLVIIFGGILAMWLKRWLQWLYCLFGITLIVCSSFLFSQQTNQTLLGRPTVNQVYQDMLTERYCADYQQCFVYRYELLKYDLQHYQLVLISYAKTDYQKKEVPHFYYVSQPVQLLSEEELAKDTTNKAYYTTFYMQKYTDKLPLEEICGNCRHRFAKFIAKAQVSLNGEMLHLDPLGVFFSHQYRFQPVRYAMMFDGSVVLNSNNEKYLLYDHQLHGYLRANFKTGVFTYIKEENGFFQNDHVYGPLFLSTESNIEAEVSAKTVAITWPVVVIFLILNNFGLGDYCLKVLILVAYRAMNAFEKQWYNV